MHRNSRIYGLFLDMLSRFSFRTSFILALSISDAIDNIIGVEHLAIPWLLLHFILPLKIKFNSNDTWRVIREYWHQYSASDLGASLDDFNVNSNASEGDNSWLSQSKQDHNSVILYAEDSLKMKVKGSRISYHERVHL